MFPNLKHIHLKGMWNYHPEKVEDLDYDLSPFIDSLFIERNIKYSEYNDFDFEIFLKPNTTKRIEKKLYEYYVFHDYYNIKNMKNHL